MRKALPFVVIGAGALAFWFFWPGRESPQAPRDSKGMEVCQNNLRRIGLAFAQYAQDWDNKFPRGLDPEDAVTGQWQRGIGGYAGLAKQTPLLHVLLRPYLKEAENWHCPDDVGWTTRISQIPSQLTDVRPSSFQKYGTSYYYWTMHASGGFRLGDVTEPARDPVLFDGDAWHTNQNEPILNVLFADGHVEPLTPPAFNEASRDLDSFFQHTR